MESVSTNIILDLLMVAFISRYCTMVIIEVVVLSQYPERDGSREFILLLPYSVVEILAINITIDSL